MRNFVSLSLTNFSTKLGSMTVDACADASLRKLFRTFICLGNQVVVHGQNAYLFRGKPSREITGKMFN